MDQLPEPEGAALADTILTVAKHMRLTVITEGVETSIHADFLDDRGVHILQGRLYGRPIPAE